MKKFIFQAIALVAVIVASLYLFKTNPTITGLPFLPETSTFRQLQIGNGELKVEVADTQDKRSKGLGGRQSLAADEGMLFVFPERGKYPFWMKGLNFPLDFIWIKGDKVVDLTLNAQPPQPGQPDSALTIYQSKEDVDRVLEVFAGTINRLNIKIGDPVKII